MKRTSANRSLVREYLPAAAQTDADLAVPVMKIVALLDEPTIIPIPVPAAD